MGTIENADGSEGLVDLDGNRPRPVLRRSRVSLTRSTYAALLEASSHYAPGDWHRESVEALPGPRFRITDLAPDVREALSEIAFLCAAEIPVRGQRRDTRTARELRGLVRRLRPFLPPRLVSPAVLAAQSEAAALRKRQRAGVSDR